MPVIAATLDLSRQAAKARLHRAQLLLREYLAEIAREEIFGPVLTIIGYRDVDHAVEIANDSIYGLAGFASADDMKDADAVGRRIRAGRIYLNDLPQDETPTYEFEALFWRLQAVRQRARGGLVRLRTIPRSQTRYRLGPLSNTVFLKARNCHVL